MLKSGAVFTPGAFPTHTYVSRSQADEGALSDALSIGGSVTSIIGPSKTGKTVLVNRVVEPNRLVSLSGALIDSAAALWSQAGEAVGLNGFTPSELMGLLSNDQYVLLIDDFHYVDREVQRRISQQLKDAVARGVRVVVVSVPHRGDDAIRANPDLRGRVKIIDLDYWDTGALKKIATIGFPLLNMRFSDADLTRLAGESLRSPQLMQSLCLETCRRFGIYEPLDETEDFSLDEGVLTLIAKATCNPGDCKTPFEILTAGPRERGQRRTQYAFKGGGGGDIYAVILRAVATEPPSLDFPYAVLKQRITQIVEGDGPPAGSLKQAVAQMDKLVKKRIPGDRVFEWDPEREVIDMPDPYFVFFLRWGVDAPS